MNASHIRSVLGTALVALLAACGGASHDSAPDQAAPLMVNMPAADCEPQACKGLRIIDGNAEAFRLDAQRRAAEDANGAEASPQS
jgi:hypothetical protein